MPRVAFALSLLLLLPSAAALLPAAPPGRCDASSLAVCVDAESWARVRCTEQGDASTAWCQADHGGELLAASPAGLPGEATATVSVGRIVCLAGSCTSASDFRELSCSWGLDPEGAACATDFPTYYSEILFVDPGQCVTILVHAQVVADAVALAQGSRIAATDGSVSVAEGSLCNPGSA